MPIFLSFKEGLEQFSDAIAEGFDSLRSVLHLGLLGSVET